MSLQDDYDNMVHTTQAEGEKRWMGRPLFLYKVRKYLETYEREAGDPYTDIDELISPDLKGGLVHDADLESYQSVRSFMASSSLAEVGGPAPKIVQWWTQRTLAPEDLEEMAIQQNLEMGREYFLHMFRRLKEQEPGPEWPYLLTEDERQQIEQPETIWILAQMAHEGDLDAKWYILALNPDIDPRWLYKGYSETEKERRELEDFKQKKEKRLKYERQRRARMKRQDEMLQAEPTLEDQARWQPILQEMDDGDIARVISEGHYGRAPLPGFVIGWARHEIERRRTQHTPEATPKPRQPGDYHSLSHQIDVIFDVPTLRIMEDAIRRRDVDLSQQERDNLLEKILTKISGIMTQPRPTAPPTPTLPTSPPGDVSIHLHPPPTPISQQYQQPITTDRRQCRECQIIYTTLDGYTLDVLRGLLYLPEDFYELCKRCQTLHKRHYPLEDQIVRALKGETIGYTMTPDERRFLQRVLSTLGEAKTTYDVSMADIETAALHIMTQYIDRILEHGIAPLLQEAAPYISEIIDIPIAGRPDIQRYIIDQIMDNIKKHRMVMSKNRHPWNLVHRDGMNPADVAAHLLWYNAAETLITLGFENAYNPTIMEKHYKTMKVPPIHKDEIRHAIIRTTPTPHEGTQ